MPLLLGPTTYTVRLKYDNIVEWVSPVSSLYFIDLNSVYVSFILINELASGPRVMMHSDFRIR